MYLFLTKRCLRIAFLAVCALQSCQLISDVVPDDVATQQDEQDTSVVYTLKKGVHYADSNPLKSISSTAMRFAVTFDSTAIYSTVDPANQGDINKLYGFSDCSGLHHVNSARFGWRWYNNRLELHAYTYLNKIRSQAFVASIELGKETNCEIRTEGDQYFFTCNGQTVALGRGCNGQVSGYQLYPYFGGDEPAPHDITIKIKELP